MEESLGTAPGMGLLATLASCARSSECDVCVCVKERESVCVCACVYERESVCVFVCACGTIYRYNIQIQYTDNYTDNRQVLHTTNPSLHLSLAGIVRSS